MAQIVIDIDDKTYKVFMEVISVNLGRSNCKGIIEKCLDAIKHGKVLPKGHGRLIDADRLIKAERMWYRLKNSDVACPKIDIENAPTIIEADKN